VRLALTGTPGTGKTTVTELLTGDGEPSVDLEPIHLNDVLEREGLYERVDEERDSYVADVEALREWLEGRDDALVESHLAHHFDADRVVVLRCRPDLLADRLRERGADEEEVAENTDSEALDVILGEAVERHGRDAVYEVDTTDRTPTEVAREVAAVAAGDAEPRAGTVDFTDHL
jgi:adenylate kinase